MHRLAAAALFSIALATSAVAQETKPSYLNGREYLALTADERALYVAGLLDMVNELDFVMTEQARGVLGPRIRRCFSGLRTYVLRDKIDAYVRSKPAHLEYSMASNFTGAVVETCPG